MYSTDHVVCIVGAGASTIAGIPVAAEMIHQMPQAMMWARDNGHDKIKHALGNVLNKRLDAARAGYRSKLNFDNIEELFSYLSMKDDTRIEDVVHSISATIWHAETLNGPQLVKVSPKPEVRTNPLSARLRLDGSMTTSEMFVLSLLSKEEITRAQWSCDFITLNYDTLLESALTSLGISFDYGANFTSIEENCRLLYSSEHPRTNVFKLHGSVNWAYQKKRGTNLTVYDDYKTILINNLVPHIVPPVWRKEPRPWLQRIWRGAMKSLNRASHIIIYGYSFPETDLHMKYLVSAGLEDNVALRAIYVVDLDPKSVVAKLDRIVNLDRIGSRKIKEVECNMEQYCRNPWHFSADLDCLTRNIGFHV